jgi:uncharacterized protein (TIGR00369 family)
MDMLKLGQTVLDSQPFSRLLGTTIQSFSPQGVTLELILRADMLQQNGFAHGGIVSYLIDNALTFAGGSVLGANVLTSEYKINYVRPAQGERLQARATVLHSGKRQAVVRCDAFVITASTEKICATALGTIITMSDSNS